jgi:hypothetical protein
MVQLLLLKLKSHQLISHQIIELLLVQLLVLLKELQFKE